ncbi:hypothetical protein [Collimonas humicola]|uniref:hypothetical protein n=1 Tax=Collimonas humicola TaxID=2825886 RepID=UPI001B8B81C6|nr:hypothetical protein [Collimonas humicola]
MQGSDGYGNSKTGDCIGLGLIEILPAIGYLFPIAWWFYAAICTWQAQKHATYAAQSS